MKHINALFVMGLLWSISVAQAAGEGSMATECPHAVGATSALEAAQKLVGTYTGQSTIYGYDSNDILQPVFNFSELIEAKNPIVQGGRAFVTVTDTMTFMGGTMTVPWKEGFYVNSDGSPGKQYFAYVPSQEIIENPLGNSSVTFDTEVTERDIQQLGFSGKSISYKKHTTIKNVVTNGNIETDVITRFTTVSWKDASGTQQTRQFVSMNGYQTRTLK